MESSSSSLRGWGLINCTPLSFISISVSVQAKLWLDPEIILAHVRHKHFHQPALNNITREPFNSLFLYRVPLSARCLKIPCNLCLLIRTPNTTFNVIRSISLYHIERLIFRVSLSVFGFFFLYLMFRNVCDIHLQRRSNISKHCSANTNHIRTRGRYTYQNLNTM